MARLYYSYCKICDKQTTWVHDDMPRPSGKKLDACTECGKNHWDWSKRPLPTKDKNES